LEEENDEVREKFDTMREAFKKEALNDELRKTDYMEQFGKLVLKNDDKKKEVKELTEKLEEDRRSYNKEIHDTQIKNDSTINKLESEILDLTA
jgi:hypothetical protein